MTMKRHIVQSKTKEVLVNILVTPNILGIHESSMILKMVIILFHFQNQHHRVLIIGSGVIGLTTAYLLLEKGLVNAYR